MEARGAKGQYWKAAYQDAPDTRPEGALMIKNSSSASASARERDKRAYNYIRGSAKDLKLGWGWGGQSVKIIKNLL